MATATAGHEHESQFLACAKACVDCQIQCDMCFAHCHAHLAEGKTDHAASCQLCVDCGDCCKLAATLTARMSPLLSAEACECCDRCATECEKYKDHKHMAACVKSCRDCAKACREMIKNLAA